MCWDSVHRPPCLAGQYLLDCVFGSGLIEGRLGGMSRMKRKENCRLRADDKYWDRRVMLWRFIPQLPLPVSLLDFFLILFTSSRLQSGAFCAYCFYLSPSHLSCISGNTCFSHLPWTSMLMYLCLQWPTDLQPISNLSIPHRLDQVQLNSLAIVLPSRCLCLSSDLKKNAC